MLEMLRNVLYILQRSRNRGNGSRNAIARARSTASPERRRSLPTCSPRTRREFNDFVNFLGRASMLQQFDAGRADLPPGRPGRRLLPGAGRLRQGVAAAARRRAGPELRRPRRAISARSACCRICPRCTTWLRRACARPPARALDHVDLVQITRRRLPGHRRPLPAAARALRRRWASRPASATNAAARRSKACRWATSSSRA